MFCLIFLWKLYTFLIWNRNIVSSLNICINWMPPCWIKVVLVCQNRVLCKFASRFGVYDRTVLFWLKCICSLQTVCIWSCSWDFWKDTSSRSTTSSWHLRILTKRYKLAVHLRLACFSMKATLVCCVECHWEGGWCWQSAQRTGCSPGSHPAGPASAKWACRTRMHL